MVGNPKSRSFTEMFGYGCRAVLASPARNLLQSTLMARQSTLMARQSKMKMLACVVELCCHASDVRVSIWKRLPSVFPVAERMSWELHSSRAPPYPFRLLNSFTILTSGALLEVETSTSDLTVLQSSLQRRSSTAQSDLRQGQPRSNCTETFS